jgi:gas vesicle protein
MTDAEGAKHRKQLLNDYMDDLYDMAKEMVTDMTPEEKQMWKSKLTQIVNL